MIESTCYYLVVEIQGGDAVLIFLGKDPAPDREGEPVELDLLPPCERFGGTGGVASGRPVIGRWPGTMRFRQFRTVSELTQAGWELVSRHRVCDCWDDYQSPWA